MTAPAPPKAQRASTSLVRRLVLLAAAWSLVALLVTGIALSVFFRQSSYRGFDEGLADLVDAVYSGMTVEADGTVAEFRLDDPRTQRVYSGRYWQIAEVTDRGGLQALQRSRSLFDFELKAPEETTDRLTAHPGDTIVYGWRGPNGEPLRVAALLSRFPGRSQPLVIMAAQNSAPIQAEERRFAALTATTLSLLAAGLVFALWIGSGLVMLSVPFPALTEAERLERLPPIVWENVAVAPDKALGAGGLRIQRHRTERVDDRRVPEHQRTDRRPAP